jgi:hypothetical protein
MHTDMLQHAHTQALSMGLLDCTCVQLLTNTSHTHTHTHTQVLWSNDVPKLIQLNDSTVFLFMHACTQVHMQVFAEATVNCKSKHTHTQARTHTRTHTGVVEQ